MKKLIYLLSFVLLLSCGQEADEALTEIEETTTLELPERLFYTIFQLSISSVEEIGSILLTAEGCIDNGEPCNEFIPDIPVLNEAYIIFADTAMIIDWYVASDENDTSMGLSVSIDGFNSETLYWEESDPACGNGCYYRVVDDLSWVERHLNGDYDGA